MFIKNGIEDWYLMHQQFFNIFFHSLFPLREDFNVYFVGYQIEKNKFANYHTAAEIIPFFDTFICGGT